MKLKKIYATELGISLIDTIPSEKMKSVPLTVEMEKNLKQVRAGKMSKQEFLQNVYDFVTSFVNEVKKGEDKVLNNNQKQEREEICKCPNCNSPVYETKFGFSCSNYKNGCRVTIYSNALERLGKKNISKALAIQLLTKGKTNSKVKGFKSKAGKDYEAYITYEYNEGEKFPNNVGITFDD